MALASRGLLWNYCLASALAFLFVSGVFSECVFEFRPVYKPGSTTIVVDYKTYFNNSPTTDCGTPTRDLTVGWI